MIDFIDKDLLNYVESNSQNEPQLLKELNRETHLKVLNPRMLSGSYQGRLLSLLSKIINSSIRASDRVFSVPSLRVVSLALVLV